MGGERHMERGREGGKRKERQEREGRGPGGRMIIGNNEREGKYQEGGREQGDRWKIGRSKN